MNLESVPLILLEITASTFLAPTPSNALQELSKAYVKAYHGSVLVTTIVTDVTHSRRVGRSPEGASDDEAPVPPPPDPEAAAPEPGPSVPSPGGGGDEFDPNFTVMFNIMLWFSLTYSFSLIAVVYVMMDMDPGRDSVIYRMTNIRMKKDV